MLREILSFVFNLEVPRTLLREKRPNVCNLHGRHDARHHPCYTPLQSRDPCIPNPRSVRFVMRLREKEKNPVNPMRSTGSRNGPCKTGWNGRAGAARFDKGRIINLTEYFSCLYFEGAVYLHC